MKVLDLNKPVLVLNFSYEPLNITDIKRAVSLIVIGKAEMVEPKDGLKIHSPSIILPVPSVIRLKYYINPYTFKVKLTRKNLFKRDDGRCQYCGTNKNLTVDHIIPVSRNGETSWKNCVVCCHDCNSKKGDRTPQESGMKLLKKPKEPTIITFLNRFTGSEDNNIWDKYLFLGN
jgi:5-methylcytosine-specific restriction endonuclease McrA